MIYLGYEIITSLSHYYIFYIFNSSFSEHHLLYIIYVNPQTHTVLNYTAYVPLSTIFALVNGSPTVYTIGNTTIPAIEFHNDSTTVITSINHVILEKKSMNETIRLVFANYSHIANEEFPDLNKLAGTTNLLDINYTAVLGLISSILIYVILRRFR